MLYNLSATCQLLEYYVTMCNKSEIAAKCITISFNVKKQKSIELVIKVQDCVYEIQNTKVLSHMHPIR